MQRFKLGAFNPTLKELFYAVYGDDPTADFEQYKESVRFCARISPTCIISVFADPDDETIWWIDGKAQGHFIGPKRMRQLLILFGVMGAHIIAVDTQAQPRYGKYWELVGLQKIGPTTYSIRVEIEAERKALDGH